MDAVIYLLDALRLFRGKSQEEVREITFEIGMLGSCGLDINDPKSSPGPAGAAGEDVLRTEDYHKGSYGKPLRLNFLKTIDA